MSRPGRLLVIAWAVLMLAPACATHGLAFSADTRVKVLSPKNRQTVALPVEIRWDTPGLKSDVHGRYYAVFVDRAPVQPGQSLRAVADDACNRTPGCPDISYLADRYVFVTQQTSVSLQQVPATSSTSQKKSTSQLHEATIVLIDANGRRIGEAAYTVDFKVKGAGA